jgi:hypothetical protein
MTTMAPVRSERYEHIVGAGEQGEVEGNTKKTLAHARAILTKKTYLQAKVIQQRRRRRRGRYKRWREGNTMKMKAFVRIGMTGYGNGLVSMYQGRC